MEIYLIILIFIFEFVRSNLIKQIGVLPIDKITYGRVNARGIGCLYLVNDAKLRYMR